jgi:hypothetical protein
MTAFVASRKAWLLVIASCAGVLFPVQGCSSGKPASGGVVSCDIVQGGLHYCEEVQVAAGSNTGCPSMPGFTPGTGCSRSGVAGTCSADGYTFVFYGGAAVESVISSLCGDGGTLVLGSVDASASGDSGGLGSPQDSSSVQADGSDGLSCTVTFGGAISGTEPCMAQLQMAGPGNGTPYVVIGTVASNEVFSFDLSSPTSIGTGSYSPATLSSGVTVSGSAYASVVSSERWELHVHDPSHTDTGTFTLVINDVSGMLAGSNGTNIHGTLDATLEPVAATGASATVTVHVDAP